VGICCLFFGSVINGGFVDLIWTACPKLVCIMLVEE
jgi:hypothetical protein